MEDQPNNIKQIQLLKDALAFYADPNNYISSSGGFALQYDPKPPMIKKDNGEFARKVLEQINQTGSIPPPIGLKPKWLHDQQRQVEIMDAMMRYLRANKDIPQEWMDELYSYTKE